MDNRITGAISDDSVDIINLTNYAGHVLPTDIDSHTIAEDLITLYELREEADQHAGIHQVMEVQECIDVLEAVMND